MLCLAEANGNANAQASIGQGVGGSAGYDWANITGELKKTGKTKSLGDATGTVAITGAQTDSTHVSVCGLEDLWNLQWEFVQGIFFGNSGNASQDGDEVYIYKGNRLWCDYFYGIATGQVCLVGGHPDYGSESGPLDVHSSYAWSAASSHLGARPAYFGPVTIVDGKDIS